MEKKFAFPSAYTVLIILTAMIALLSLVIPSGRYEKDEGGSYREENGHFIFTEEPKVYYQHIDHPDLIITREEHAALTPAEAEQFLFVSNLPSFSAIFSGTSTGLYGIEGTDGRIAADNSGILFGAIKISLFVIVVGGFIGVLMHSGAIDAGIFAVVQRLRGKEIIMIPILMTLFAVGGTTYGMAEETIGFYFLIATVMVATGFDPIVAVATILLGAGCGVLGSTINPFATGIASEIAGINMVDGLLLRVIILIGSLGISIFFVMRYALQVKKNPEKSFMYGERDLYLREFSAKKEPSTLVFTARHKAALFLFALTFAVMIIGVIPWGEFNLALPVFISFIPELVTSATLGTWWFTELTIWFFFMAVLVGIVLRMKESKLVGAFIEGASGMVGVALIIGIARTITIIMINTRIQDTVLYFTSGWLEGVGPGAFVVIVEFVFIILSFLIPSTSGLATVAMPIFAPLAEFAQVPVNLVVTAFQNGAGLVNLITPTSAVVMGGLAITKVSYDKWLKFVWKPLLAITLFTLLVLVIGVSL